MGIYAVLRMLGSLATVLGMLAAALYVVRRYNVSLPGRIAKTGPLRRLELVERTSIDQRRSVALLRRDGREHLILLTPEGNTIIESGIVRDALDEETQRKREEEHRIATEQAAAERAAQVEAFRQSVAVVVDTARQRVRDSGVRESLATIAETARTRIRESGVRDSLTSFAETARTRVRDVQLRDSFASMAETARTRIKGAGQQPAAPVSQVVRPSRAVVVPGAPLKVIPAPVAASAPITPTPAKAPANTIVSPTAPVSSDKSAARPVRRTTRKTAAANRG